MKALELFSGPNDSGISGRLRDLGWEVDTVDINPDFNPSMCMDVMDLNIEMLVEENYDFIWAGVDCSCFSMMTVQLYWDENSEPTERNWGEELRLKAIEIIDACQPDFWVIENPRAMMRTRDFPPHWGRYEVAYCQYDWPYMKPTDLFGYLPSDFHPKKCKPMIPDFNHVRSPRGSPTGIQGLSSSAERAMYPPQLVNEICFHVTSWLQQGKRSWFS